MFLDGAYGKELVLDLHRCNSRLFTRDIIRRFFHKLCDLIEMEREDLHFWDDLETLPEERETEPHLVGTSAIQFIRTSNITIHTLDMMERVYLNVFSCKDFDEDVVAEFCEEYFGGEIMQKKVVSRV